MPDNVRDNKGFLVIDCSGNAVLIDPTTFTRCGYSTIEFFIKGSIRRCCTVKQLDKIVRHYKKTGDMIPEEELE